MAQIIATTRANLAAVLRAMAKKVETLDESDWRVNYYWAEITRDALFTETIGTVVENSDNFIRVTR